MSQLTDIYLGSVRAMHAACGRILWQFVFRKCHTSLIGILLASRILKTCNIEESNSKSVSSCIITTDSHQKVFCTLMQHGRLHLRSLLELSGLSRRHLKNGLAVLIQQHLTLHSTEEGVTYYQANWPQAYDLVRSGKIIKHVENRFGENAAGIISNLLLYGHAEVGELAAAYDFSGNNRKSVHSLSGEVGSEGQVNGNHASAKPQQEIRSLSQLHNLLSPLLAANYITTVNSKHFLPQADIHNRAEDMVKRTSYEDGVKGKKLQAEFKNKVKNLKRKWRDDPDDHVQTNGESNAKNSSSSHAKGRPRKRVRLNGALVNGALYNGVGGEHSDDDDDETAYLAVCSPNE